MDYPTEQQGTNHSFDANVYTRLGVKPFINANLPFTFLSATVVWPEVRRAIDEAAHYMVDVVELQRGVGRRLAEISGAQSGMVSSGAAGSDGTSDRSMYCGHRPRENMATTRHYRSQRSGYHVGRAKHFRQRAATGRGKTGGG